MHAAARRLFVFPQVEALRALESSLFSSKIYRIMRCLWLLLGTALIGVCQQDLLAAEHVIHISIDGLNASLLQQCIDAGTAPNFKRLQDEGAWTTNARTDCTHTNTLPNHTCMLTGRPVLQPAGMAETHCHQWTTNKVPKVGASLHDKGNPNVGYVASVFDVVHDAGLSTALYASKDKFILYDQTYGESHGAANARGRDKIDVYFYENDGPPRFSATMHERFLSDMASRYFNYAFVHYRDTDTIGHALGWGSSAWKYALRSIDANLGGILHLVESDPKLAGTTAIIVNTDHGGTGFSHDDPSTAGNYTIPILVWGAGAGRGDLYELNRDCRADPGDLQPAYTEPTQPIRNGDTGNLALRLLGLGPIPHSVINAKQDLRVSLAGDYNLDGKVDTADYVVWRKTEGSTTDLRADGNGDGRVDQADHEIWRANLSSSASPAE